ncbi:MAG: tRNA glutamyl-Q(34) synthetase GluQRS [Halieaceae bacterium]|nr:tRNA glutamyl-Q(34) synthetase GluQRS [Halieaceae bacterium]
MRETTPPVARYRGRFAPSPTGPLHLGSLTAALASYLDAQHHNGDWLLRLEDIDPPREVEGAATGILNCLAAHGLKSANDTIWQHNNWDQYRAMCLKLLNTGHAFYCQCPRRHQDELGRCVDDCKRRDLEAPGNNLRVTLPTKNLDFADRIYGLVPAPTHNFDNAILWRRDDLPAYLLAVVVDDIDSDINHIVRGDDLLHETHRQLALYQLLGKAAPKYAHIPVVLNAEGKKLSKQTGAQGLDNTQALWNLQRAAQHLGLDVSPHEAQNHPLALLEYALQHWRLPSARLQ